MPSARRVREGAWNRPPGGAVSLRRGVRPTGSAEPARRSEEVAPPCRDSDRTSRPFHLRPGPTLDEVARQLGLDSIADLASNESPWSRCPR